MPLEMVLVPDAGNGANTDANADANADADADADADEDGNGDRMNSAGEVESRTGQGAEDVDLVGSNGTLEFDLPPHEMDKWVRRYKMKVPGWQFIGTSKLETLNQIPMLQLQLGMLETLNLSNLRLAVGDTIVIAEMVAHADDDGRNATQCSLKHLDLSSNYLTNVFFTSEQPNFAGIHALAKAMKATKSLTRLDLACISLCGHDGRRHEGLDALSEAMMVNTSLKLVNLQGNKIPEAKANKIWVQHSGAAAQAIISRIKSRDLSKGGMSKTYLKAFNPDMLDIFM